MRRVAAITGIGSLGSYGRGLPALAEALKTGVPRLTEVDRSAGYHRTGGARLAALMGPQDLSPWVSVAAARRMSPTSRWVVAAAQMALEEAGGAPVREPTAVVMGTAFGQTVFTERLFRSITDEGPESASPFLFTECVANVPAGQVAIHCGATGPNLTVVEREASALIALGRGAREVEEGRAARVLVGAVDEMTPLAHAVLDRFGALARASPERPEQARPLDRHRNGFLASEGATVLVLEEEGEALARGAHIFARVAACGGAFDPSASRVGWGQGVPGLAQGLLRMLARGHRSPGDIDRIVSGASGSVAGDRLEGRVLRQAFGKAPLPPVLIPKAITGEYAGGFLAATVLATQALALGPCPTFDTADPEVPVVPYPGGSLSAPRRVLATSLAAGGAAAWVLLETA